MDDNALLKELLAYYRERAPEYDLFWPRGTKLDEESSCLVGFQRAGSLPRAQDAEPPSRVAVARVASGCLVGKSRRSAARFPACIAGY